MPKMGESVQEGTILRWVKKPGDTVERDEIIAEISTDKVDTEIPSPIAGTLAEIVAQENETVEVGAVIAYMAKEGGAASAPAAKSQPAPAAQSAQPQAAPASQPQAAPATNGSPKPAVTASAAQPSTSTGPVPRKSGDRFYSPLVRSIADKEGVGVQELDALQGSGDGGRVTKNDLLSYVSNRGARPAAAPQQAPQQAPQTGARPAAQPAQATGPKDYGPDVEVVPMDRMRQLIAEHMVRSKHTSPHVTEVGEADVTPLVRLRESVKEAFKKQHSVNLTYTAFFIAAVARALRENPWVNASVDGTNILVKKHVNVGVATALPDGNLIVPVIKDADYMNIAGIAHAVNDLATRARNKQLSPDEIAGGTFTVTNYGVFGLLHGAPIISQPQVAILGTGAIQKRAVVRELEGNDIIAIRSMVYLSLSHDHRVIDGLLGGKFLSDVIRHLESFNEETAI
ncbi:MAG: 2-oxo acid dehydrogenase subunit E2 [bacterium]|nr:2-oxo acid dehydrogenase subunit E2 [Candidatus Kapabacteria bacterium]